MKLTVVDLSERGKRSAEGLSEKPTVKIGVRRGSGRPPGYEWDVYILDGVYDEALALIGAVGCRHLTSQVQELAYQSDPTHSVTIDVKKMESEDFYELRDKGGVLGKKNVRLFFGVHSEDRTILVLGLILKQNDGKTPLGDLRRMQRRWRMFRTGASKGIDAKGVGEDGLV